LLPVSQYQPLFHLISNSYGGDGVSSFAVPNMAGRTVYCIDFYNDPNATGQLLGSETVTLDPGAMPAHSHSVVVPANETPKASASPGSSAAASAGNSTLGVVNDPNLNNTNNFYNNLQPDTVLNTALATPTVGNAGSAGPAPISIMQPYLVLNYCICTGGDNGIWPQPG
jgi:microcystin-dependent protein